MLVLSAGFVLAESSSAFGSTRWVNDDDPNGPTIDNAGSHAEIKHNRILGVGPTATIAQNGIQVSRGATADIQHNFVSGHVYTPMAVASTGILHFRSGEVLTQHNSVSLNDVGVDTENPAATTAFGWDRNYPWYDAFGAAANYDWATPYAGIDTDSLLQLLPEIPLGGRGRVPVSPQP